MLSISANSLRTLSLTFFSPFTGLKTLQRSFIFNFIRIILSLVKRGARTFHNWQRCLVLFAIEDQSDGSVKLFA